jgi:hypothetical protein
MLHSNSEFLSKHESHDAFGPILLEEHSSMSANHHHHNQQHLGKEKDPAKLESENQQLLREVLTCRKNLDIAQQNVSTLKALCNQLAQQLNSANSEIAILREKRGVADLSHTRETELRITTIREKYEEQLTAMRKELEEQNEIYTQLATESQDSHRKADKSFKDIIATKDGLIAELTRTVECLQAGMRSHTNNHNRNNNNNHSSSSTSSLNQSFVNRSSSHNNNNNSVFSNTATPTSARGGVHRLSSPPRPSPKISSQDAIAVRNSIIEPTIDLLRLSLRAMKDDVAKRHTPLGEVNAMFYSSDKKPVTRYFVDVQADKNRLDDVPTFDLLNGKVQGSSGNAVWPKSWKFHTPQGELITLSLDVESL